MPFKNNDTLQKWHMTNILPETDKYSTRKTLWARQEKAGVVS